jgi:hypothetical protein
LGRNANSKSSTELEPKEPTTVSTKEDNWLACNESYKRTGHDSDLMDVEDSSASELDEITGAHSFNLITARSSRSNTTAIRSTDRLIAFQAEYDMRRAELKSIMSIYGRRCNNMRTLDDTDNNDCYQIDIHPFEMRDAVTWNIIQQRAICNDQVGGRELRRMAHINAWREAVRRLRDPYALP